MGINIGFKDSIKDDLEGGVADKVKVLLDKKTKKNKKDITQVTKNNETRDRAKLDRIFKAEPIVSRGLVGTAIPEKDPLPPPAETSYPQTPGYPDYSEGMDTVEEVYAGSKLQGKPSMFNSMALLAYHSGDPLNKILEYHEYSDLTKPDTILKNECIATLLVKKWGSHKTKPLKMVDFAFCKYFKFIPENRMITVRRYAYPVTDNVQFPRRGSNESRPRPIAQAVTYFGEPTNNKLSTILNVKGKINWKELTAEFQDIKGNEQGNKNSPTTDFAGGLGSVFGLGGGLRAAADFGGKVVSSVNESGDVSQRRAVELEARRTFNWENRTRGNVNVIKKTHIRDNGIGASVGEYALDFTYEMRSYNGVNAKIAMLDIMCNFLSLAYTDGKFWGGTINYFPNSPKYKFLGDQNKFYNGDYGGYLSSVFDETTEAGKTIFNAFGSLIHDMTSGNFIEALGNMIGKMGHGIGEIISGKNRPAIIGYKALLNGDRVGTYHMTVGNPNEPIAMIGNLICTGWSFKVSEELGVNDFPTEITYTLNLKDAMERDSSGVQSIFSGGNGRMYLKPQDMQKFAVNTTQNITGLDVRTVSGVVYN